MSTPIPITPDSPASTRKRNINIWKKIRVFYTDDLDAVMGTDGTIDYETWAYVGLMASGSSLGKAPETTRNKINAFGESFIMNDVRFTNDVRTFTALEENDVTFAIMNPGSQRVADGEAGVIVAPEWETEGLFLFEATNSWGDRYYEVTRNVSSAYADAGLSRGDDGAATVEITVEVPKGNDGGLYDYLTLRADGEMGPASLEPIRITDGAATTDGDETSGEG